MTSSGLETKESSRRSGSVFWFFNASSSNHVVPTHLPFGSVVSSAQLSFKVFFSSRSTTEHIKCKL